MGRLRPAYPGETWTDPKTGRVWEVRDPTHIAWQERRGPSPRGELPRMSDRSDHPRGYDVKAEDVIVAGGAAFAALFRSEAALWVEAGRLARQFMRDVDRGESAVNQLRDWLKTEVAVSPSVSEPGSISTSGTERRPRRFDSNPYDGIGMSGVGTYAGKVPPGFRPGRGGSGARGRSSSHIRGHVYYTS